MSNPIYLAVDVPTLDGALALADKVKGHVGGLKLGLEFFCAHGHHGVREMARTGLPISAIAQPLAQAEAKGLIERDFARVWPSARGFDFLSDLQQLFLPPG